jgi:IMP dehydrogenase
MTAKFIENGITFSDVLLVPKYSNIKSRSEIKTDVSIRGFTFNHPMVPANMKTITGIELIKANYESKGLSLLHRFDSVEDQIKIIQELKELYGEDIFNFVGVSVGVQSNDKVLVTKFLELGIKIFCIDVAHGHSKLCESMVSFIDDKRTKLDKSLIIAGNVATYDGAVCLYSAGADVVKVNIGAGSTCTTRIETGAGVPQLTALMDVFEAKRFIKASTGQQTYIIADGGVTSAGDVVKSLCFGDLVMSGNLFAGCDETPGSFITIDGIRYKEYVGSSTHKTSRVEGVSALVNPKGSYKSILQKLIDGIQSGCSYQGVNNLNWLKENPEFIKISNASWHESKPHDLKVIR